jgi:hypothetical protein
MQGYAHKKLKVADPPPVRLAFEHAVVLDDGVEVLHAAPDELDPLVPGHLLGGENPTARGRGGGEEAPARREVAIADVELPRPLWVKVARLLVDVRVERRGAREIRPKDELPREGDANEDEVAGGKGRGGRRKGKRLEKTPPRKNSNHRGDINGPVTMRSRSGH